MSPGWTQHPKGSIEVICGPMFSGKSEELIRRVRRAQIAKIRVQVFKPSLDDRYHASMVASHNDGRMEATPVSSAEEIRQSLDEQAEVVAIDEVQFLDEAIVEIAETLADRGIRVILAGLDQDFRGDPFGIMPSLLARAEFVTKLQAVCMVCGSPASRSQRMVHTGGQVLVGAAEAYEPRCRFCHTKPHPEEEGQTLFDDSASRATQQG